MEPPTSGTGRDTTDAGNPDSSEGRVLTFAVVSTVVLSIVLGGLWYCASSILAHGILEGVSALPPALM